MTDELTLTDDEREAAEAAVDKVLDKVVVSADVVLDAALDAINARRRSETDQPVGTIVRHKKTGQLAEVVEDQGVRRFRPLQRAPLGVGVTVDDSSDWQTVFKPGHETLLLKSPCFPGPLMAFGGAPVKFFGAGGRGAAGPVVSPGGGGRAGFKPDVAQLDDDGDQDDDEAGEYVEGTVVDAVGFVGIPALPLDGVPGTFRDRDGDLYRHRNGVWQFADRGARLWAELGDVDMLRNFGPYRRVQLVK
ncbi:hypothetical protein FIONNBHARTH_77 [Mycobacterium phage Fionnbharth]|uniref:Uncharacterized protein n=3 Tax=Fionnbharthvirus TaxID=2948708 RepID=A0A6G6XT03_9CAUD|nr:hypothetical protein ACQ59_gp56 [Mycobacterium phage Fionnbharth]YP_009950419.1 hypothetical protein I5G69_gp58 [Mycobacterium phage Eponine]AER26368.1 hypothetical protein FIONNBHARTH_77 [Mycobacterium phage Fionnbharth]ASR87784.1 hypothetical protein WINTERMUTE_77 [Mycobacterium phage Wintermute]QIG61847.1 hypothetical protein SEA_EPONINE_79 [Mycobacterium phage Eponine]